MKEIEKFEKSLEHELENAKALHNNGIDTVICEYCKKLMSKNDDIEIVYNIVEKRMEYSHPSCWEENNVVNS